MVYLFAFCNDYPIFPSIIITVSGVAFLPLIWLLIITQIAPLHSNCRYILSVWTVSFGAVYLASTAVAILDLKNESGFMPLDMYKPAIRFKIYQAHVTCSIFCSFLEIALSIERIIAILNPRRYYFSGFAWKTLSILTILMAAAAHFVDCFVHSEQLYVIGAILSSTVEITILAAGALAKTVCRIRFESMYGNSSLTARYQVKEAYEMSRAMIPAYMVSFILKVTMIIALGGYLALFQRHPYLLGYLHAYYCTIHAANGSFAMIILLLNHPQLRKQSTRKFRKLTGKQSSEKVESNTAAADTELYFSMLAVHWQ